VNDREIAERLASLYEGRALQGYVRWKVRTDLAYSAARDVLCDRTAPLVDVGCGVGLLPLYLREHGHAVPILGIDFDQRKIDVARKAAQHYDQVEFIAGDARDPLPRGHDVILLDVLHYFDAVSQKTILTNAANAADVVVIRQGIRDGSWRHRFTAIVDGLARVFRWMKAERLNFPTRAEIEAAFAGFDVEVRPLWGKMPYNSYLLVFRRRAAAHRQG
jgi:2-polyprenyl-3-methyl-5-hydroxy-6-metoxy-1,4-benzoquinol methylase